MAVPTLATDMMSSSSAPVPLAAVLDCQLFLLVYKTFLLVRSGHFYLNVLGPGVPGVLRQEELCLSSFSQQEMVRPLQRAEVKHSTVWNTQAESAGSVTYTTEQHF